MSASSALLVVGLVPGVRAAPMPAVPRLPALTAAVTPVTAMPPAGAGDGQGVSIASGEAPSAVVAHWDPGDVTGPSAVDLYDAASAAPAGSAAAAPLRSIPVVPGLSGVDLAGLDPSTVYQAVVTVTGPGGARRLGPSPAFRVGPSGPLLATVAAPSTIGAAASTPTPPAPPAAVPSAAVPSAAEQAASRPSCLGAGYGAGVVSIDGWAGVQGSYCMPPAFTSGTGAFCVDHGLDYPSGAYTWAAATVGNAAPLVDQYDRAANPADAARLAWVVASFGATTDPARSVAVGAIAHAVMGDYPGLSTADLAPARLRISGGDPAATSADVASMWSASGAVAGPYQATISVDPGPYVAGDAARGTVTVTGRGGGAEAGVPVSMAGSTGATVALDQPATTGPAGTVGFSFTPTAAALALDVTAGPLPATTLTLWTPQRPPVAVQRVVTTGAPVQATGSLQLAATLPGTATLVKVSSDLSVPVGAGFGFDVAAGNPDGTWHAVAHRDTGPAGSMAPVGGLLPGTYRVTETAHPPAFTPGGPWTFSLGPGEQARWQLTDTPVPQTLRITKAGDDTAAVPIGAGVVFAVSSDSTGDGSFATPLGSLTTGADGTTPPLTIAPGRYRISETTPPAGYQPAAPQVITVPAVGAQGPVEQDVTVTDKVVQGTLRLEKTDAATGLSLAGAALRVEHVAADGTTSVVGTWTSGLAPVDVSSLLPGRYIVSEVSPPSGYLVSAAPETVTIQPGETLEVAFADRPIPAPAASSPTPLGGAPSTTAPSTTAPTTTAPAPVGNASAAPAATLAFTGLPVWRLLLLAVGVTGLGATLVGAARRRSPTEQTAP